MSDQTRNQKNGRSPRRVGCGMFMVFLLCVALLGLALVYFLFFRPHAEEPLDRWIPPEADAAAVFDLDPRPEAWGGAIGQVVRERFGADAVEDLSLAADQINVFLYPRMVGAARLDRNLENAKWAVVANVRRGERLFETLAREFLGVEVETIDADPPIKRVQLGDYGVVALLRGSQLFVGNDPEWIDEMIRAESSAAGERSWIAQCVESEAPFAASARGGADTRRILESALSALNAAARKPAESLTAPIERAGEDGGLIVLGWPSESPARLRVILTGVDSADGENVRTGLNSIQRLLEEEGIEARVSENSAGIALEALIDDLGQRILNFMRRR